jgi:hypothetical protein
LLKLLELAVSRVSVTSRAEASLNETEEEFRKRQRAGRRLKAKGEGKS